MFVASHYSDTLIYRYIYSLGRLTPDSFLNPKRGLEESTTCWKGADAGREHCVLEHRQLLSN